MSSNPCKICGGTDLTLVDGFYYCVECGTQDVNVRETVVEQTVLADGTFAHTTAKKFTTVLKDAIEMSGEWNKWHAYNFILAGLTEELMSLGAEPSVKTAILWIWTRYIKMFQVKEDENKTQFDNASLNESINSFIKGKEDGRTNESDEENDKSSMSGPSKKNKNSKSDKFRRDIKIVTKGTLLTILYVALNLDRSDIQLSHLLRFVKEGRLSLYNCTKFVPKEIKTKSIPHWKNFILCQNDYTPKIIRTIAMTIFKRLNLGLPLVPDLNTIICNYVKELCLPNDFKNLVLSLMNLAPCDFLKLDSRATKSLVRLPDYEGVCMAYILVALKMCFGLDSDYELKVSDEVDRINYEESRFKSYKLGSYSEPTDRLFSFQEWYRFLLFRKTILCKYYLPMARLYKLPVDECVLMEHLKERNQRTIKLSDTVTMDTLNKIGISIDVGVIPKKEFPATFTPMTTYTEVILQHQQDPDFRLLLSEDFTQYSLKYAISDLNLPGCYEESENIIQGVSDTNKTINRNVIGSLKSKTGDTTMVFVRNCENKHWLKTKPPTINHVIKASDDKHNSDKDSDLGYDSNIDITPLESDETKTSDSEEFTSSGKEEKVFEIFEEEHEDVCIFDDNFSDMNISQGYKKYDSVEEFEKTYQFHNDDNYNQDSIQIFQDSPSKQAVSNKQDFNLDLFDRDATIAKCIELACKKYKIPPSTTRRLFETPGSRKRGNRNENQQFEGKRKKRDLTDEPLKLNTNELIRAYYKNLENDILIKVAENVKTTIDTQDNEEFLIDEITENNEYNDLDVTRTVNEFTKNEEDLGDDNEVNDQTVISSIYPNNIINSTCKDEEIIDDPVTQSDPKFDPTTHDIDQLYVKLTEDIDLNCSVDIDSDPEFYDIIDRNIDQFRKSKKKLRYITSDSEDDLPLSEIVYEKSYFKKNRTNLKCENLISNTNLQQFYYWMRHYRSRAVSRSLDMNEKFDMELMQNCSKSFVFVIRECAAILDCTTFSLYKFMQNLEETLLKYCDS